MVCIFLFSFLMVFCVKVKPKFLWGFVNLHLLREKEDECMCVGQFVSV